MKMEHVVKMGAFEHSRMTKSRENLEFVLENMQNDSPDISARLSNLYGIQIICCEKGRKIRIAIEEKTILVTDFATNSPFALNLNPSVVAGAIDAVKQFGAVHSSIASARANTGFVSEISNHLIKMKGGNSLARIYPTTFAANIATASAVAKMDCTVIMHPQTHATVQFAVKGAIEKNRIIYTKNTVEVASAFSNSTSRPVIIVEDGLYSMGQFVDFSALKKFLDSNPNGFVWLDDAHSVGMRGKNGRGEAMEQMIDYSKQTIVTGSFGKAFGAAGGFLVGPNEFVETILGVSVSDRFSCNLDIAAQGSVLAAMKLLSKPMKLSMLKKELSMRLQRFDSVLASYSIKTEQSGSPIAFRVLHFDGPSQAIQAAGKLLDEIRFLTTPVYYPTIGKGKGAIRVSISAGHKIEDIDKLALTLVSLLKSSKKKSLAKVAA